MSELDPSLLQQPSDMARPALSNIFNQAGIYSAAGFPLFARDISDYDPVGGLRLLPYERGDSPCRDASEQPYNATWFEHLREHYGGALKLLETLRQEYAATCTPDRQITPDGVIEIYHMGVQMPQFLMWRGNNPVPNGEIPPELAVLRQALLGVGTTLLPIDRDKIPETEGKDIARLAEESGDLIGDGVLAPNLPLMVCPASPEMITGLANALLKGNEKRGLSTLLSDYEVDLPSLQKFVQILQQHIAYEEVLFEEMQALFDAKPKVNNGEFALKHPTKVELFDRLITKYCKFLNEHQPALYETLGRTDTPPRMHLRQIYKLRAELLNGRINAMTTDDPSNITMEMIKEFEEYMPSKKP